MTTGHSMAKSAVAPVVTLKLSAAAAPFRETLARAGLSVDDGQGSLPVVPIDAVPKDGPAVCLYDGKLQPVHAPLISRRQPVHLLALRDGKSPTEWELQVLAKLLRGDKLRFGEASTVSKVGSVEQMTDACANAARIAQTAGGKTNAVRLASSILHELCANALLDAPVDAQGRPLYAHRRDDASLTIDPKDACWVAVASDGKRLYLSAADRFGRMTPAPLARAIQSLGGQATLQTQGGGAGLGLRLLLEQSDLVAYRVQAGYSCEVMAVLDLSSASRRGGSIKSVFFQHDL